MENNNVVFRYDSHEKKLTQIQEIELKKGDLVVGKRKMMDIYDVEGTKILIATYQEQKNTFEKQIKDAKQQLDDMKEVSIDEEFMKKLASVKAMNQKKQVEATIENTTKALKHINRDLNSLKGSGAIRG